MSDSSTLADAMIRGYNAKNKRPKYGNRKVEFDGIKFDSVREQQRYSYLKDAQNKGLISELKCHVKFELIPAVTEDYEVQLKTKTVTKVRTLQRPITYTCDFQYMKENQLVTEDIKISEYMLPKEYILKEKLMFALKGIKIKRVYKPTANI